MIERARKRRRAFTMLTVLWVMSAASVVGITGMLAARNAVGSGRNRVNLQRAMWRAEGCARRAQAAADEVMQSSSGITADVVWRTLGTSIASSALLTGCDVVMEAAGTRVDLNAAPAEVIERLLAASVAGDRHEIAQRVVARRDTAAFSDVREVAEIEGLADVDLVSLTAVASTDGGRISLATASSRVLVSVPGIEEEVAEAIVARQRAERPVSDLSDVLGDVSSSAAASLLDRYPDASRLTTANPDAWVLTVRARNGFPPSTVALEWRLVRDARGVLVVRARGVQ